MSNFPSIFHVSWHRRQVTSNTSPITMTLSISIPFLFFLALLPAEPCLLETPPVYAVAQLPRTHPQIEHMLTIIIIVPAASPAL
ncbi:hypothetical protein PILCRDRAFT_700130 [Piloderma croceum F 1598]|uniref:Uncharacterized protein n=1 Tax=Piloderma croceum (strain F 1598) TaxID=765440 RepID=A0A0C3F404_PILCF|nr:hypothetical protein PILCRDRAFT_700130 [Piloderma croceum F 1598]